LESESDIESESDDEFGRDGKNKKCRAVRPPGGQTESSPHDSVHKPSLKPFHNLGAKE
jgi:hypothetical protein